MNIYRKNVIIFVFIALMFFVNSSLFSKETYEHLCNAEKHVSALAWTHQGIYLGGIIGSKKDQLSGNHSMVHQKTGKADTLIDIDWRKISEIFNISSFVPGKPSNIAADISYNGNYAVVIYSTHDIHSGECKRYYKIGYAKPALGTFLISWHKSDYTLLEDEKLIINDGRFDVTVDDNGFIVEAFEGSENTVKVRTGQIVDDKIIWDNEVENFVNALNPNITSRRGYTVLTFTRKKDNDTYGTFRIMNENRHWFYPSIEYKSHEYDEFISSCDDLKVSMVRLQKNFPNTFVISFKGFDGRIHYLTCRFKTYDSYSEALRLQRSSMDILTEKEEFYNESLIVAGRCALCIYRKGDSDINEFYYDYIPDILEDLDFTETKMVQEYDY